MSNAREALLERAVDWFTEQGVGDTSLRTIAEGLGTSHRMLHYHFGPREGLLTAVVTATWGRQHWALAELLESPIDPYTAAYALWDRMADQAARLGPLFFEVAAAAMQGKPWAAPLGQWITEWTTVLEALFARAGHSPDQAMLSARMTLAMARGLLFELALAKGEGRAAADTAIHTFLESTRAPGH
ncbi:TetR/AcrR family transcriptional regulator [Nocardia zapadnayensis]|uniref:TetR/AcrR family transcriptional regulator n=1 Tax=Nocardia rhamnosiphila TaxID=426716 RepID=UPI002245A871|nr:TetR/AcrR family transcriptional regulator [Nocardia zapadnayensis]MCX0275393.1 TetR/AcrR family transcriptional regulator [Nocardia zapadnayensis]